MRPSWSGRSAIARRPICVRLSHKEATHARKPGTTLAWRVVDRARPRLRATPENRKDPQTAEVAHIQGYAKAGDDKLTELLNAIRTGRYVDTSKLTLGAWLTEWIASLGEAVRPATILRYRGIVESPTETTAVPFASSASSRSQDRRRRSDRERAASVDGHAGARDGRSASRASPLAS